MTKSRMQIIGEQSTAQAIKEIVVPTSDAGGEVADVMVILEGVVAGVLIAMFHDPRKAAHILNEGLLEGIEQRIAHVEAGRRQEASKKP